MPVGFRRMKGFKQPLLLLDGYPRPAIANMDLDIAFAARRRDMFGLAAHAFARGMTVQMLEDDDEHEMREAARASLEKR